MNLTLDLNVLLVVLISIATISTVDAVKLKEKFKWREVEFDWPSEETKQEAISSGKYVVANNLPLGLERWRDKLFITVPRWKSGVAASLTFVNISDGPSPVLQPYPNWQANELPETSKDAAAEDDKSPVKLLKDNNTIISTFRVRADDCDRLWVMDTGLADILGNPTQHSSPSLAIFDLYSDKLLRRHYFPEALLKEDSFFANVIVDADKGDCDNAFAYMPDLGGYQVIVYSLKDDKSWRIKHNFFHFDPLAGDYNVGGVNFQWTDGIFGMAVGKRVRDGSKPIYFHAFSSTKEFMVSNRVLQNETYSQSPESYYDYKLMGDRGPNSQSSAEFYDPESGVIFYTQVNKDGVGCWNTAKQLNIDTQGLVDSDSDALVFPNDLKVDNEANLWVLSDRLPTFIYKELDPEQYNYRILTGSVNDLIRGTPCAAE